MARSRVSKVAWVGGTSVEQGLRVEPTKKKVCHIADRNHFNTGNYKVNFKLTQEEVIAAVEREGSDEAVAEWFLRRPDSSEERVAAWNALAPNIGKPGFPAHRTFAWGLKNIYIGCTDPRVDSGFTAIAWDEGFLDVPRPEEPNQTPEPTAPSRRG